MSLSPHRQPITLYLKLGRRRARIGNEQTGRVGAETSRACERFMVRRVAFSHSGVCWLNRSRIAIPLRRAPNAVTETCDFAFATVHNLE